MCVRQLGCRVLGKNGRFKLEIVQKCAKRAMPQVCARMMQRHMCGKEIFSGKERSNARILNNLAKK